MGVPLYMLIEHSFHTNKKATLWLSKEENLKRLAVAEAELLAAHFKMEAKPESKPESKKEGKVEIMGTAEATGGTDGPLLPQQERRSEADELHP